jgi:chromosomal replication initiator protein
MKITDIQIIVCDEFNISLKQMLSRNRRRDWSWPRHVAMGLVRELLPGKTLMEIANAFKRSDHTTVLHALGNFERMQKDAEWRDGIKAARDKCLMI